MRKEEIERKNGASPSRWSFVSESVCGSNVFFIFAFSFFFAFAVSLPLLLLLFLSYFIVSVMDFLRFFYMYQMFYSLTFLHLEYINMLLICINIVLLLLFLLLYEVFFHILYRLSSRFFLLLVDWYIYTCVSVCMCRFQYCTWIVEEENKINEKNNNRHTNKTNCLLFQFLYFFYMCIVWLPEVCGKTSMRDSHTQPQWYESKWNYLCGTLSFILDFLPLTAQFQLKCFFTISEERKNKIKNRLSVYTDTDVMWMGKNDSLPYKQTNKQFILVQHRFTSSSFINFSILTLIGSTLIIHFVKLSDYHVWYDVDLNSVSHLWNYYVVYINRDPHTNTDINSMKRKSQ